MGEAEEADDRPAKPGEEHGADEGAGHGAGEVEVVIGGAQAGGDVAGGRAVDEDIVGGLDVEGLLYLCVRGQQEVEGDEGGNEPQEEEVCFLALVWIRARSSGYCMLYLGASL